MADGTAVSGRDIGVDACGRVNAMKLAPPPYTIKFTHVHMTPKLASGFLERNTHNRKIRKSRVAKYALAMLHGGWKLTHECVAITSDNIIVDGQHRLVAVIEAGVPVWMVVAYNVPMAIQEVIDDGAPRSMADALTLGESIEGSVDGNTTAIARVLHEFNVRRYSDAGPPNRMEIINLLRTCGDAVKFARRLMNSKTVKGVTTAPVAGAVAVAFFWEPEDRLSEFIDILHNGGLYDSPRDSAAHLLYFALANSASTRSKHDRFYTYRLATRAIKAFSAGEPIKLLKTQKAPCYRLPDHLIAE